MYVRCERTLIIVGIKRRIYSPSFECLILSVDIPEHSGPSSRRLECVSVDDLELLNVSKQERKGAPYG